MRRNLLVSVLALAMVTVFVPGVAATHVGVGAEDTVAATTTETTENPTVVGETVGDDGSPYGVGTKTADECYQAEADVSADQAAEAATREGFCGQLRYNDGTDYEIVSPTDQQFRTDFVGQFDVVRSWGFQEGTGGCIPMCDDSDSAAAELAGLGPQNTTGALVHDVGAELGLTDPAEDAEDRSYFANAELEVGHAPGVLQRSADVWTMNGWTLPAPLYASFVGYLYDHQGQVITGDELETKIEARIDAGTLSSDTEVGICGYTPDRQFQGTASQGFCELGLSYVNATADSDARFDGYDEACKSPTYVCGATTGGYWEAEQQGLLGAYAGRYQGEHTRWHWVIAPSQPACPGMEPGFRFSTDTTGEKPFLAHDLDVYVPPGSVSAADTPSTDNPISYAKAFNQPSPDAPAPVQQTQAEADNTTQPVRKEDVLEPNHVGAETSPVDDDSRQDISVERTLDSGCSQLFTSETSATKDPWVNYLDNGVREDRTAASNGYSLDRGIAVREPIVEERVGPTKGGLEAQQVGLYGTQDDQHDNANDPTPDTYHTAGNVGVFTDKNNDGDYDVVAGPDNAASGFGAGVYSGLNIQEVGAYPMLWDMHAEVDDETGEAVIDGDAGCLGPSGQPLPETMKEAGYGPNTGLAQAIYLREPTVVTDGQATDPEFEVYDGGNNIYLFLNEAGRTLWDADTLDGEDDHALSEEIDELVEGLTSYVVREHEADPADLQVAQPGGTFGLASDFASQCGEDTGGYRLALSFTHTCEAGCEGDTIATKYVYEVTRDDGSIGGGPIPIFKTGGTAHDFGTGVDSWHDLDPFDGDADRNAQRTSPPPTGE